jgi:integrase
MVPGVRSNVVGVGRRPPKPLKKKRGDGRIWFRKGYWQVAFWGPRKDGLWGEIRESTHSDVEEDAVKLLRQRLREAANHKSGVRTFQGPQQERLTVGNLLDSLEADYRRREIKSLRKSVDHMKPVRSFFGHQRAIGVTPDLIRRYQESRRAEGRSNAKINREVEFLSAAFGLAVKEDRIARRPYVPTLPENNARRGFFEKDEFERILPHLPAPMDDVARFGYVSGWRKEEIRTMRWSQVDRSAREVRLFDSKNGEGRLLPLDEGTWALFEKLWERRRFKTRAGNEAISEYVFHMRGKPVSDTGFKVRWQAARDAAGLPGKLFHDLRRTAARNMIRAGVPQAVAMAITGHKTDSMFRRYNVTSGEDVRDALRRQRAYLAGQAGTNVRSIR